MSRDKILEMLGIPKGSKFQAIIAVLGEIDRFHLNDEDKAVVLSTGLGVMNIQKWLDESSK